MALLDVSMSPRIIRIFLKLLEVRFYCYATESYIPLYWYHEIMTGYLILGITYAFAAAVQPGPFQTFLISQTLSNGWRRTAPAAFAPLISDGPIILLVLLVLSQIPAWLASALQIAGGVFLMYLAFGAYKNWRTFDPNSPIQAHSAARSLFKAALVNLLNPNPYLAWSLVMGPLLLKAWREAPIHGVALLVGFYATMVLVIFGIILLFATSRNLGPRVSKGMVGVSCIALICFGCYELWMGVSALLGKS
jgi:threonine/homoserine/homoserine lactone efflux protein